MNKHSQRIIIFCLSLFLINCKKVNDDAVLSALEIVDRAIEISGGLIIDHSIISFDFRDKSYYAKRQDGLFKLTRKFHDTLGSIKDVLNNNTFKRFIDNEEIPLNDSIAALYKSSVNSVHYFSVLPYGLNDDAVIKERLDEEIVNGQVHHKIKVSFKEEGGGEDHDDIFVYWFEEESFKLQYLAYSYSEDDGVGMRFREAYNERYINNVRFVDYNNYKAEDNSIALVDLANAFENNQLTLLSKIELRNIVVDLIND